MSDLIDRQAAIDACMKHNGQGYIWSLIMKEIEQLPSATDTNVATKLSTNLAEVGTDCISRQQAIDALRYAQHRFTVADEAGGMGTVKWSEYVIYFAAAERVLSDLPSAQPDIIRCRNCKFASGDSRICMKFGHSPIGELDFCSFAERREVNNESD